MPIESYINLNISKDAKGTKWPEKYEGSFKLLFWVLFKTRLHSLYKNNFDQKVNEIEGYLYNVTWLDGRIWSEINVLTFNLIRLGGRFWIETLCRPEILL